MNSKENSQVTNSENNKKKNLRQNRPSST
jgi:hypothetical protein